MGIYAPVPDAFTECPLGKSRPHQSLNFKTFTTPGPRPVAPEELHLTLASSVSFARLKGIVDALAVKIFAKSSPVIPHPKPQPGYTQSADIIINGIVVGTIGQWQLSGIYVADYLVSPLQNVAADHPGCDQALPICSGN
jgi:hypothetical protein